MSVEGFSYALNAGIEDPIAKLAMLAICDSEFDGECTIDINLVSKWACCDDEIAYEAMRYLVNIGLITFEKEPGNNDLFYVTIHALALARNTPSTKKSLVPPKVRREVYDRDGFTCAYCHEECCPDNRTLDHIIPQSKGGLHAAENLVVSCQSCNSKKGARTPEEWRASQ